MVLGLMLLPSTVRAGRIERVREEIRSGGDGESKPSKQESSGGREYEGDDDEYEVHHEGVRETYDEDEELLLDIFLAPFRIPYLLVESREHRDYVTSNHPYQESNRGNLRKRVRRNSRFLEDTAVNLSTDASYQYDGLWRGAASARLSAWRLELDTTWRLYLENLDDEPGEETDSAVLGNAHLCYRFAQNPHLMFRAGAGYAHWIDGEGSEFGFDTVYGFDVFPRQPLILSVDLGLGSLGDAFTWRARGTLGANLGPFEIYAGYEHVGIGSVPLGGPVLGARAWF
jgi:hypothetical protein